MSVLGFFTRTAAGVLRIRALYHTGWKNGLAKWSAKHGEKADTLDLQAMALDEGADKFAPRRLKAKVIAAPVEPEPAQISPPPPTVEVERRALAVAVQNFRPSRAADDCQ